MADLNVTAPADSGLSASQVREKYDQAAKLIGEAELLLSDVYWNFTVAGDEPEIQLVTEVFKTVQAAKIRTEDEAIAWRERVRTGTQS